MTPAPIDLKIDLDQVREVLHEHEADLPGPVLRVTHNLIAAVGALRERGVELEDKLSVERAMVNMHKAAEDRAVHISEAAEARGVELWNALDFMVTQVEDAWDPDGLPMTVARGALATTPAQAMERDRLEAILAARSVIDTAEKADG